MPRLDISSGTNAFISAGGNALQAKAESQRQKMATIAQIGETFKQFGENYMKARDKNTRTVARMKYAESLGLDPEIARDETTGLNAISAKVRENVETQRQTAEDARQQAGFSHSDARSGFDPTTGSYDTSKMPGVVGANANAEAADRRAEALSRGIGGEAATLGRPVGNFNDEGADESVFPGVSMSEVTGVPAAVPATNYDVANRADALARGGKAPRAESIDMARSLVGKPVVPPKIDPYSREGIDAQKEIVGAKPPTPHDPYGGRTREQWLQDRKDSANAGRAPATPRSTWTGRESAIANRLSQDMNAIQRQIEDARLLGDPVNDLMKQYTAKRTEWETAVGRAGDGADEPTQADIAKAAKMGRKWNPQTRKFE